jgi:branched-chain amino acid transport system ATP-binding protein
VPQGREIFPNLSVEENMMVGIAVDGEDPAPRIKEVLNSSPAQPPAGPPRRRPFGRRAAALALARCLCRRPKLMLLDEPTEGIQPSIIDEIEETLKLLASRGEITIVLVEQNLDFIPPSALSDAETVGEFVGFSQ